jgi:hypothetical protein
MQAIRVCMPFFHTGLLIRLGAFLLLWCFSRLFTVR